MRSWDLFESVLLFVTGVVAGIIGTAGGVTSLVSFPVLVMLGLTPLAANVTNSVALLGSGITSIRGAVLDIGSQPELLRHWMPQTIVWSAVGAALLLAIPGRMFSASAPVMIFLSTIAVLLQPSVARWQATRGRGLGRVLAQTIAAMIAIYNGYFGAGSGILFTAFLMLTGSSDLRRANAAKNALLCCADLIPAIMFVSTDAIVWPALWPLAIGAAVGGWAGPPIARRVPLRALRILVGTCGLGLAVYLAISSWSA